MVTSRHPGRLRRTVSAAHVLHTWNFLCGREASPWQTPTDLPPPTPSTVAWEKQPAHSSSEIVQKNLSSFWTTFNPDLELPTPDDIFPDDEVNLDELRWRSAPWGTDDWEEDNASADEPTEQEDSDIDDAASDTSAATVQSCENLMSGIPLKLKLLPGKIHLLNPKVHHLPPNSSYDEAKVPTATPIKLRNQDGDWYHKTLSTGVHLPRPKDAPKLFRTTKPSALMDTVVDTWIDNGLLIVNPDLKFAQPMFLVPKPDNKVRPIIDYSEWTQYIVAPKFSLLSAGAAIRDIPLGNVMIKLDLRSGFHQIPLARSSYNHNGISYRGIKYSLTRLPMGHALAPFIFQRFAEAVLDEILLALNVEGIAYLDDWLLHSASPEDLTAAIDMIEAMGITLNLGKSIIEPTTTLQYLGFKINSVNLTIQLTLSAFDRLTHILRYTKQGSLLDRQRIRGYATWILYNLRLPIFLASDVLLGDASWLLAAIQHPPA